ncbi:MAG: hypothetical protein C4536_04340, partial [Actinobacteria bacterium]
NFGENPATATITFLTAQGEVPGPQVNVAPGQRASVNAGNYVTSFDVATRVTSDNPLVVERSCYYSPAGSGRTLGTCD